MLYTELTNKAKRLAYRAHHGQNDKSGVPYIFHPYHVAEQMGDNEYAICVALLHDTVEDTDVTLEDLAKEFPEEIVTAVALLTHDKNTPYEVYLERIKENPLALSVKIADINHNSDEGRLSEELLGAEKCKQLREKYSRAKKILTGN